jgi:hypothetical protein
LARLGAELQDGFANAFALTALVAAATLLVGVGASLLLRPKRGTVTPAQNATRRAVAEPAA